MSEQPPAVIISLCSGYGGLDEAVIAATGAPVVAHVEYDEDASKVLDYRYPDVPNYGDLTTLDWEGVVAERVPEGADVILCGGYPCQPFSSAGKRLGTEDHRHLWPYIADGIKRIKPRLVIFENVRNHLNLGFDVVLASLAELGYDVTWTLLKASDVGAPHGRARLFILGRAKGYEPPLRVPLAVVDGEHGWLEPSDGLFGAIEWKGKIPVTGRVADGAMYPLVLPELTEAAEHALDGDDDEGDEDYLPTPRGATARTSRKALTADGQWSAPSLEQAVELAKGELPREYESWDEVRGRSAEARPDGERLLKTPTAQLAVNGGSQHPDKRKEGRHGPTLADEVEFLLPTPLVANGKSGRTMETSTGGGQKNRGGHSGPPGLDEVASLMAGERPEHLPPDEKLPPRTRELVHELLDGRDEVTEKVLPTPTARDWKGKTSAVGRGRNDGRVRGAGDELLPDVVERMAPEEGKNLPTPTSRDYKGANQRGDDSCLAGALLPTPRATDAHGPGWHGQGGQDLRTVAAWEIAGDGPEQDEEVLPTPTAADGERTTESYGRGNPTLPGALLPTPNASDGQGGVRPVPDKRTHGGVDHGPRLRDVAPTIPDAGLLPTPTGALGSGGQTSRSGDRKDEPLLPGIAQAAADGRLLPTPTAQTFGTQHGKDPTRETVYSLEAMAAKGMLEDDEPLLPTPTATIYGTNQSPTPGAAVRPSLHTLTYGEDAVLGTDVDGDLLPTPRATDGTKGSPNQHGSSGDLMLVPAVLSLLPEEEGGAWKRDETGARVLPTPTAQDAAGARNTTAYRSADAGPHADGTTLTDVMWLAAGHEPGAAGAPDYKPVTQWGPYEGAVRRWERVVGPAPAPTEPGMKGKQRLAPPFPEWMMGLPSGWVTEVPGVSRNAQLKILGNGVVPQQGYAAIVRLLALAPW